MMQLCILSVYQVDGGAVYVKNGVVNIGARASVNFMHNSA